MAYPRDSEYHADSDADDEFEQNIMTSPTQAATDSDGESSSEPPSAQHTPTTFGTYYDSSNLPKTIISEWTSEECTQFLSSLNLQQYCDAFLDNGIDGEALIALKHEELKEMGIHSLGHRLTLLKRVYDVKMSQDVPVETDDFVPLSTETSQPATKEDVWKVARSVIRLRDERIAQAEAQLAHLNEEYRKLQQQLMPVFKMVKEQSTPLPVPNGYYNGDYQDALISPPVTTSSVSDGKSSLTRKISQRLPGFGSGKNNSPTHIPSTILEKSAGLKPSAAANQAALDLGNGMHHGSPATSTLPSPTSPNPYPHHPLTARSFSSKYDGPADEPFRGNSMFSSMPMPEPPHSGKQTSYTPSFASTTSTLINPPSRDHSQSVPPHIGRSDRDASHRTSNNPHANTNITPTTASSTNDGDAPSVEIFKSFRVALEDPCYKVLPAALRKYNIQADWRQYALYIVYGDQERCVGLEEKPLQLFKDLDKEGKRPMFMLRKLANPVDVGIMPSTAGMGMGRLPSAGLGPGGSGMGMNMGVGNLGPANGGGGGGGGLGVGINGGSGGGGINGAMLQRSMTPGAAMPGILPGGLV